VIAATYEAKWTFIYPRGPPKGGAKTDQRAANSPPSPMKAKFLDGRGIDASAYRVERTTRFYRKFIYIKEPSIRG